MTGTAASSTLRRLFEAAGYRLDDRPEGVRAYRPRDRRVVLIVRGNPAPTDIEPEFPTDAIHRTLIYSDDPGEPAKSLAAEQGIEVLGPTSLGPALGELLLPPPDAPPPEEAAESEPLEPPASAIPEGERTVRPRLERRDAEALAGLDGVRFTLRLIPFYVAPYRVRSPTAHGGPGPASDHLVAVNALNGQVEIWEAGERELVGAVDEPHQRVDPALTEDEARKTAEAAIRRRHTVSVDHTEQHGGTIVIERRKVGPGPGDVRIGVSVLVHVPYWYAEGPDGRLVLDAVTGTRTVPDASGIDGVPI
ncbi:MAG TPA: hypothetical protein VJQ43_05420 [Thermoplasmata archaeon]|nr:hypothetical protein [Thermoplasmata archaeon]